MKKTICFLLTILLLCPLAACGQPVKNGSQTSDTSPTAESAPESAAPPAADSTAESGAVTPEGEKTLVVYFSATGNTEGVARHIAELTDGDLFELVPKDPYDDADLDWTDRNSRVSIEHGDPEKQLVELLSTSVANWESYTTVYLGYPIWWGVAAWPVNTFLSENDFTGKTVVPFCTSASSGVGDSARKLAETAGTGVWLDGRRFSANTDEEELRVWIASLQNRIAGHR